MSVCCLPFWKVYVKDIEGCTNECPDCCVDSCFFIKDIFCLKLCLHSCCGSNEMERTICCIEFWKNFDNIMKYIVCCPCETYKYTKDIQFNISEKKKMLEIEIEKEKTKQIQLTLEIEKQKEKQNAPQIESMNRE